MITALQARAKSAYEFFFTASEQAIINNINAAIIETCTTTERQFIQVSKADIKDNPLIAAYLDALGYSLVDAFDDIHINISWAVI